MYLLVVDTPTGPLTRVGRQLEERFAWTVGFAEGGRSCLEQLKSQRWDAVITARQLRDIDGLSLLTLVRIKQPSAVRLLLDRRLAEQASLGQRADIAHRILEEQPTAASLRAILTALNASPLNMPQALQDAIGAVAGLPAVHEILMELRAAVADPDVTPEKITRIISVEPMLAAKVLHLANAGFAGQSVVIDDLGQAAALLGVNTLQQVVIASAAFSAVAAMDVDPDVIDQAQRHGAAASRMAAGMPSMPPYARTGALLLDVGLPLMALAWPMEHAELRRRSRELGQPLHEIEREELGTTHADAGALLARRWSLPQELAQMVSGHHLPPLSHKPDRRALGFQVHHAVQTDMSSEGVDVFDVTSRANLPAWV